MYLVRFQTCIHDPWWGRDLEQLFDSAASLNSYNRPRLSTMLTQSSHLLPVRSNAGGDFRLRKYALDDMSKLCHKEKARCEKISSIGLRRRRNGRKRRLPPPYTMRTGVCNMEYYVRAFADACLCLFGGYAAFILWCHAVAIISAMIGGAA